MDEDLERAGPSIGMHPTFYSAQFLRNGTDTQRDDQVRARGAENTPTTTADDSALIDAWMKRLQMLTLVVSHTLPHMTCY